jgi:hypothetical protein
MPCRQLLPFCLFSIIAALQIPFLSSRLPANNAPYTSSLVRVNSFVFTDLAFGNQTFKVSVDTGSSDTWLVSSDFACIIKDVERPQAACGVGLLYDVEDGFTETRGEVFHAWYEPMVATGLPGMTSVTFAGLTVTAEVGVV